MKIISVVEPLGYIAKRHTVMRGFSSPLLLNRVVLVFILFFSDGECVDLLSG